MSVKIVCSDMHFGDKDCSLYSEKVSRSLWEFWAGFGEIDELILAGDILDANLSSLTEAIEGFGDGLWPRRIGLKGWLGHMLETKGMSVKKIVYIPGNHDYVIFDYLATEKAFLAPLFQGKSIPDNLPVIRDIFKNPFIRGVAPKEIRDNFVVHYPDYCFSFDGRDILITHGHYLDKKQTLFKSLKKRIDDNGGDERKAVRDFFIATAQYQTVARAASYMRNTREYIEGFYKPVDRFFSFMDRTFDYVSKLRNCPIEAHMLNAIETYITYLREPETVIPDIFIFGHTHEAGVASTWGKKGSKRRRLIEKKVTVYNTGSFLEKPDTAGSFLVIRSRGESKGRIELYKIDLHGRVEEVAE